MKEKLRFLGMDVHAETIAAAIAEPDGEVRSLGTIPNRMDSVRKLLKKLGPVEKLRVCYEAGPTGSVLYWQLAELGVQCEVIAPSLVPVRAGDRVKTDRRDARTLADACRLGAYRPAHRMSDEQRQRRKLVDARALLVRVDAMPVVLHRHLGIFQRGRVRQQVKALKHKPNFFIAHIGELVTIQRGNVNSVEPIMAASRPVERTDHVHQRAFAGAAGTHDSD